MNANGIGIQVVMPKSGTRQSRSGRQGSDQDANDDSQDRRAPPPPGQGQYVDRLA
jgi:hypothetical protein